MLHCAICDDESLQLENLRQLVAAWAAQRDQAIDIRLFSSAEAFLFAFEENLAYDLLILDIQMTGMDGITLAQRVRTAHEDVQILFVTAFADYMAQGYEVSALHYLMKPVAADTLYAVLDKAVARMRRTEPVLLLRGEGGMLRLRQRDILYAEALSPMVRIVCADGIHETRQRFAEIIEGLAPPAFVRSHRSYLVGLRHISRIERARIAMDNGDMLPLARRAYDTVHQAFIQYYRGER